MAADLTFMQSFKQSDYGCNGAVEYEAPYTGIHYVAVFGRWRPRIPGVQRSTEEFEVDLTLAPPKSSCTYTPTACSPQPPKSANAQICSG